MSEGLAVRVAERLRVLGQPVRLRLVEMLTGGSATPQELSDALGLSQQNVSKHLLSLYRAGVVTRRPHGANVFYELNDVRIVKIVQLGASGVSDHLRDLATLAAGPTTTTSSGAGKAGTADIDQWDETPRTPPRKLSG